MAKDCWDFGLTEKVYIETSVRGNVWRAGSVLFGEVGSGGVVWGQYKAFKLITNSGLENSWFS